jgi:DNA polymerase-3 subunit epsilon
VDLRLLPDHCRRVVVAAALTSEGRFGDVGAVALTVDAPSWTVATSTLDAATSERTLLLAEVYRRGDVWRLRAVGQGYDDGLAEMLTSYGVDVNDPDR